MEECIFCKIVKGEIPCTKVFEDESVLCFKDINPQAPFHVIIIPKKHISSLNELNEEDSSLASHILFVCRDIACKFGIDKTGYRVVINCGEDGGQTVKHMHFHLLGGRNLTWPPG